MGNEDFDMMKLAGLLYEILRHPTKSTKLLQCLDCLKTGDPSLCPHLTDNPVDSGNSS